MKSQILLKIESKLVNGLISRSDLKAIYQHPATSPSDACTLLRIMNQGEGLGKQLFNLKSDLGAFIVMPYTTNEVIGILNQKSSLMSHKEGLGMYRKELLSDINDARTPDEMKVKLNRVLGSGNGTRDYFLTNDFNAVFKK